MEGRRTNDNPWSNPNDNPNNRAFSLPPQDNLRRIPPVNWSPRNSVVENPNLTPYPAANYYDMLSEFEQLGLANPPAQLVTPDDHVNRGVIRNNSLNNGMPLSHLYYSNGGGLRGNTFNQLQNPLQGDLLFNEYAARTNLNNLNSTYYGHDVGYDLGYGDYSPYDKYFGGNGRDEYLTRTLSRGITNRSGSSFGRNRTRFGNGTSFNQRVESLNGYRDRDNGHVNYDSLASSGLQNGCSNGVYAARQISNFSSLEELKGKLVLVAMDQQGGRFLQSKIEEGNSEDVEMIYSELKDRIRDLMVDQFANYIIQKLFDVCNEEQITNLLLSVVQDDQILLDICVDMHGTKVMQKLIENLSNSKQRSLLISVLRRITVVLMKSVNGHHVIQSCFKCFPPEDKKQILNVVADNCLEIATDQSGCCVLQQCVIHAEGELRERLVAEIIANALILSEHPYGNYVVQHIVGLHIPIVTAEIVARLSGNFVFLSMNKHGSNVVEHILKECPDHINTIISEIINSQNLLPVVQHPYGNYVIQTALTKSKGTVHYKLMTLIQNNYAFLHSHLYGKRVLAKTRTKGSRSFRM